MHWRAKFLSKWRHLWTKRGHPPGVTVHLVSKETAVMHILRDSREMVARNVLLVSKGTNVKNVLKGSREMIVKNVLLVSKVMTVNNVLRGSKEMDVSNVLLVFKEMTVNNARRATMEIAVVMVFLFLLTDCWKFTQFCLVRKKFCNRCVWEKFFFSYCKTTVRFFCWNHE